MVVIWLIVLVVWWYVWSYLYLKPELERAAAAWRWHWINKLLDNHCCKPCPNTKNTSTIGFGKSPSPSLQKEWEKRRRIQVDLLELWVLRRDIRLREVMFWVLQMMKKRGKGREMWLLRKRKTWMMWIRKHTDRSLRRRRLVIAEEEE